ncbi:dehydrodolichyl diphosphate synthase complex subunit Nus1 [Anoplophora glabripennis]|uniref:dehydrodolichyl diphosphate synthase complex subunit Nus1 n=1 Tax=Anoplophora glabripennis TaxID=217634 RepID=UPI000874BC79|nr:dehydrodolichyl diphosphate synthase complex subunit Nus1 [Anoplophora glabripennis]
MWKMYMYRTLYLLVHGIYTIFEYVHNAFYFVVNTIITICHEVLPASKKHKQIKTELHKIIKTPAHLTVLVGHEEPSVKDLANLIIWCLATQISFISFYDYKGTLKKNEDELRYEVDRRKAKEDHVIWHSNLHSTYRNGFTGQRIHVKIITEEDGKKSVADLTKAISLTKNREFSVGSISEGLRKYYEFPDPDLGLVCGKTLSCYNYPPWQIRVTEFFTIESLHNITFPSFIGELVKYGKCEQRLGK